MDETINNPTAATPAPTPTPTITPASPATTDPASTNTALVSPSDPTQPNDMFVATVLYPQASLLDLHQSDINAGNTGLLPMESYKNTELVKQKFTDDKGVFNDVAFKQVYAQAASQYGKMTNTDVLKNLSQDITYDPGDVYRPLNAKTDNVSPILTKINNPFQEQIGYSSLYGKTDSNLSVRELAQQNSIYDTDSGTFTKDTPNDLGLLGNIFSKPLVYAQYEDGETSVDGDGRTIKHSKGEYKLSPEGKFYTRTLGHNEEIYGKEAVAITDVMTKEGTWLNSVDFFDSDGKDKSITGTIFKIAASVAPYLITKGGINDIYGGIQAVSGLLTAMPTFYKSIESILTGNNNLSDNSVLFNTATAMEGVSSKFKSSMSDAGKNS